MTYVYWYLFAGVAVLAAAYVADRRRESWALSGLHDILKSLDPRRQGFWRRFLEDRLVPVFAATLLIAIWPVAVVMAILSKLAEMRRPEQSESWTDEPEKEFAVLPAHLRERLTRQEIESRERVVDPLGAVPEHAFGHLNASWTRFNVDLGPEDEIWSFEAEWQPGWWCHEQRAGYVMVRNQVPGRYFLTVLKTIESVPSAQ